MLICVECVLFHAPITRLLRSRLMFIENKQQLEHSFKEFAGRPENKTLLEQHQREEVAAALQLQEHMQELLLQKQVSELEPQDQALLAPVLRFPVLRQLLLSLSNNKQPGPPGGLGGAADATGSSAADELKGWLANGRVTQLLRTAARSLRKGHITEEQLLLLLQQQLKAEDQVTVGIDGLQPPRAAPHQALLPSHLLVEALNEHLTERNAGNAAYRQQQYDVALHHYKRALAIVDFVVGSTAHDQAEVQHNKATVLLNMAAVHMAMQDWGAAVSCCDTVLQSQPLADEAAAKAWLRRAKANLGRHEFESALQDLDQAAVLDAWNEELSVVRTRVVAAQRSAAQTLDRSLAAKMLRQ